MTQPTNTDDELRTKVDAADTISELDKLRASIVVSEDRTILKQWQTKFWERKKMYNYAEVQKLIQADRKKHELDARIDEHALWKPIAEEIVSKDGVYRGVNYLNKRSQELAALKDKQEK